MIPAFTPIKIKNTSSEELDGQVGSIIGIASIITDDLINYIVFLPKKISNGYYSIVLPNCCIDRASVDDCATLMKDSIQFISSFAK